MNQVADSEKSKFWVDLELEFVDGKWTGKVESSANEEVKDDLSALELKQMRTVTLLVMASLELMAQDRDFFLQIEAFTKENYGSYLEEIEQEYLKVHTNEGVARSQNKETKKKQMSRPAALVNGKVVRFPKIN